VIQFWRNRRSSCAWFGGGVTRSGRLSSSPAWAWTTIAHKLKIGGSARSPPVPRSLLEEEEKGFRWRGNEYEKNFTVHQAGRHQTWVVPTPVATPKRRQVKGDATDNGRR